MTESESRDPREIKVVDRRKFTVEGERRASDDDEAARDTSSDDPTPEASSSQETGTPEAGFEHRPVEEPEGVDFTLLINAMAQPVVILLDEVPHADPRENQGRLEQARLQIDLIDLLRIKCRGNLTADEERLLGQVLYQLRMLYVSKRDAR